MPETSRDDADVLIVGGGPAGSSCALALVGAGLDVLVLDKAEFPRDKVCAGWITPQIMETLEFDAEAYRQGRVFQPMTGFRTGVIGGTAVETRYDHPVSFGIRRREFDHYLLQRSGARLRLGEPVRAIQRQGGGWRINGRFTARLLIGAGGHWCPVARHLGAEPGRGERIIAAQEAEIELDPAQQAACATRAHVPEIYFCDDLGGYGWCIRKGDFVNIGLGREDPAGLAGHMGAFMEGLVAAGRVPPGLAVRFHGHAYLLYPEAARPLCADAALLIGDAAGLAYPQSGEGIRPAIESGLLAAQVIEEAGGDYGRSRLEAFEARLTARLGRRGAVDASQRLLPSGLRRAIAHRLLASRRFSRHVVLNRWFFHANQPALAPPAAPHRAAA